MTPHPTPDEFYEAVLRAVLTAVPHHPTEEETLWRVMQQGFQFLVTYTEGGHPQHHQCVLCDQPTTGYHALNQPWPHRLLVFPLCPACQDIAHPEPLDTVLLRRAAHTPLARAPSLPPLAPTPGGHPAAHDHPGTPHDAL